MARKNNIFSSLKKIFKQATEKFPTYPKAGKPQAQEETKVRSKKPKKITDTIRTGFKKVFKKKEPTEKKTKSKKRKTPKIPDTPIEPNIEQIGGIKVDIDTGEILEKVITDAVLPPKEEPEQPIETPDKPIRERDRIRQKIKEKLGKETEYSSFEQTVINNFKNYIDDFPDSISNYINNWIDSLIAQRGIFDVAQMLEDNSEDLQHYLMIYPSDQAVIEYCSALIQYLPAMSEQEMAELQEYFEQEDDFEFYSGEWDE